FAARSNPDSRRWRSAGSSAAVEVRRERRSMSDPSDPHADQPIAIAGLPLAESKRAVVMLHGRNASARNILDLVPRLDRPDFSYVAPAAANNSWYPFSFLEQVAKNEPYLASAINRLKRVVGDITAAGIPPERIALLGFSQGACL